MSKTNQIATGTNALSFPISILSNSCPDPTLMPHSPPPQTIAPTLNHGAAHKHPRPTYISTL